MTRASSAPYPDAFRVEVVCLYRESEKTLRAAAEDLGVSTDSLARLHEAFRHRARRPP